VEHNVQEIAWAIIAGLRRKFPGQPLDFLDCEQVIEKMKNPVNDGVIQKAFRQMLEFHKKEKKEFCYGESFIDITLEWTIPTITKHLLAIAAQVIRAKNPRMESFSEYQFGTMFSSWMYLMVLCLRAFLEALNGGSYEKTFKAQYRATRTRRGSYET